jgi:hypothetical protein
MPKDLNQRTELPESERHPVDIEVGSRIKIRRKMLGLSHAHTPPLIVGLGRGETSPEKGRLAPRVAAGGMAATEGLSCTAYHK